MRHSETVDGYPWTGYHRRVRNILRHEYGYTGVSRDLYREQWCAGNSVDKAAEQIAMRVDPEGMHSPKSCRCENQHPKTQP